ncbi:MULTISPECIES: phage protease [Pasteurellaceae]|uniref:Phage protease n=1 Tax=Pasteurella atlantica TaxID=2827233 RepID=A0AAW8CJA1_9PAST|nr:phage protease [Pasteurella atlantica]MDP8040098.1 phage protease [Pasteurella atlantica]MDP8042211.1 phage protease [Pasteurella atlantica]MDP8044382.1 phage protease [Pasteurella atlantica]MDP8046370.1 phage protease [Pasteurella atlantica]MDP8062229.1 phage protease [Pasteurella atlantica]
MATTLNPIACNFEIDPKVNGRIQLFPFGRFYPQDGRKEGKGGWYVDDSNGYALAEQINSLPIRLMIDYEHQTLFIKENGKENPAAGWFIKTEYISGQGIFVDVEWTEKAHSQIKNKEYRYISPLFFADKDGKVVEVINAALTNRPALHNLDEALALSERLNQTKDNSMNFKDLLIKLFALGADATDEQIEAQVTALSKQATDSKVALSAVYDELAKNTQQVTALSAQVESAKATNPDPAKYVALSDLQTVQTELNNFKAQVQQEKCESLIQTALSDGRLLPAQKQWAEDLGKNNLTALSDYLKTVTPNSALKGTQSGG